MIPTRHKGETKEEKQARKQLVKQHNKVITLFGMQWINVLISGVH